MAGVVLALLPFDDGDVRCSSPATGARVSAEAGVAAEVLVGSCDEAGAGRLLVAGGLVGAGLLVVLGGLSVGGRQERRARLRRPSGADDEAGHEARHPDELGQEQQGDDRVDSSLRT